MQPPEIKGTTSSTGNYRRTRLGVRNLSTGLCFRGTDSVLRWNAFMILL